MAAPERRIPITIVNGFLGAGKTTLIMSLLDQLAPPVGHDATSKYRAVWLKNEFGVNAVDSLLGARSSVAQVSELLNGCLCCTLVGRFGDTLVDIATKGIGQLAPSASVPADDDDDTASNAAPSNSSLVFPDRVIIETSGSAFPTPLVQEIRRLAKSYPIELDAVVCVIDALNFTTYADTSRTARIQAQHTDLIVLNKEEAAREQGKDVEKVLDAIYDLNPEAPVLRAVQGSVPAGLVLGADGRDWAKWCPGQAQKVEGSVAAKQEEDGGTYQGPQFVHPKQGGETNAGDDEEDVVVMHLEWQGGNSPSPTDSASTSSGLTLPSWQRLLDVFAAHSAVRAKGVVWLSSEAAAAAAPVAAGSVAASAAETLAETNADRIAWPYVLNWSFGRFTLTPLERSKRDNQWPAAATTPSALLTDAGVAHSHPGATISCGHSYSDDHVHAHSHNDCCSSNNAICHAASQPQLRPQSERTELCTSRLTLLGLRLPVHLVAADAAEALSWPIRSDVPSVSPAEQQQQPSQLTRWRGDWPGAQWLPSFDASKGDVWGGIVVKVGGRYRNEALHS